MNIPVSSLFSQLLHHFPRNEFARLVREHEAEKGAKGFSCWAQFVSMLFCHLARVDSLREICYGLASSCGKLTHLGLSKAPKRSTLSYANQHRPAALFADLFWTVLARLRNSGGLGVRKKKFRFKNPLMSLDSTIISLCLNLFPWAKYRQTKGGVKVHVLLDHSDYMPRYIVIREARTHDRFVANLIHLQPGSIVAFDRAYNDYTLFARWTREGVYFVTRMKTDAVWEFVEERQPPKNSNILSDTIIRLSSAKGRKECPYLLRRIVVWDEKNLKAIEILTNHLQFGSTTIAAIYKDRWEIENFFKALKQNLEIRSFVGTTENALAIQVWTALIALVLLRWLRHLSHISWSLSNIAAIVRLHLFTYRSLDDWLKAPFGQPTGPPGPEIGVQLTLA